jgi:hypothetical protein
VDNFVITLEVVSGDVLMFTFVPTICPD